MHYFNMLFITPFKTFAFQKAKTHFCSRVNSCVKLFQKLAAALAALLQHF